MRNINKLFSLIRKKTIIILFVFGILFLGVGLITNIFAELQPVRSIEIFSENLSYGEENSGSWKIDKHAKWIEKGTVEVTFSADSILKKKYPNLDVLLVLDVSDSMEGTRINKLKDDCRDLVDSILSDEGNKVGLITFDTNSNILSDFTDKKSELDRKILSLNVNGSTNYYRALLNVDTVLKNYSYSSDRNCIVLFLTDGYPNEETPNEIGQYGYLKEQYPFITINGVQYEMGDIVLEQLKKITDNQFVANMNTLNNTLFDATLNSIEYDEFSIEDIIDNDYFIVDKDSISVSQGIFDYNSSTNKLSWNVKNYRSGTEAKMTVKLTLKDGLENGVYPISKKTVVKSGIGNSLEDVSTTETPVLGDNYKVIYDGNAPDGCKFDSIPEEKHYGVFDVVRVSDIELSCDGYQFKGWDITNKDIEILGDEYFKMIDDDVIIRANWSKLGFKKSTEGTIKDNLTLYKQVQEDFNNSSKFVRKYEGNTSTFKGKEDIYYYYGAAANNNVSFANYCWKIVRTTDTGGVKLIYNGVPAADGSCDNIGGDAVLTGEQMNRPKDTVPYNNGLTGGSIADASYMFNESTRYPFSRLRPEYNIFGMQGMQVGDNYNYYYSDTYNYENGKYVLNAPIQYSWIDNFSSLVGKYTCRSTSSNGVCENLSYVVKAEESKIYYITLSKGKGITDSGYEPTITLASSVVQNPDGTFTLVDPITVDRVDVTTTKENLRKYTCLSKETTCKDMKNIRNYNPSTIGASKIELFDVVEYKYGNSFEYDGSNYVLKDTINVWNYFDNDVINNNHYTCFNESGVCQDGKIFYITRISTDGVWYIELENGKGVDDAINEMLYDDNVNKDSSIVKKAIDYWYSNNMTDYTKYLEDTVWCNDRSLANREASGWNPNGGSTGVNLTFGYSIRPADLICPNLKDRFTVSKDNGNGDLTYPVGMLTVQEAKLAHESDSIRRSYLGLVSDYDWFWVITPQDFRDCARNMLIGALGNINEICLGSESYLKYKMHARPTISLKEGMLYKSGDGSVKYPYVIDLEATS